MKRYEIGLLGLVGMVFASLILIACADNASGSRDERQQILDSLPVYQGATLVLEYELDQAGEKTLVREYAIDANPAEGANAVTRHYGEVLVAAGWQEGEARAAVSGFSKDENRLILGRVGPSIFEPPSEARVTYRAEAPGSTGFFFTLEVSSGR